MDTIILFILSSLSFSMYAGLSMAKQIIPLSIHKIRLFNGPVNEITFSIFCIQCIIQNIYKKNCATMHSYAQCSILNYVNVRICAVCILHMTRHKIFENEKKNPFAIYCYCQYHIAYMLCCISSSNWCLLEREKCDLATAMLQLIDFNSWKKSTI